MVRVAFPRGFSRTIGSVRAAQIYQSVGNVQPFSTSGRKLAYADTINNLKIGSHTRVLYQGFTGKQASSNAKDSIEYGTKIVGGVKPGVTGEHLGLPLLPDVRTAVKELQPDASAIYVPGAGTVNAIIEAIENEIPLVVSVAEHIPTHDLLRLHQILATQSKTRLVGANSPGMINTHGRCRIGFHPLNFFLPGKVSIVNKSGTLSYEAIKATTDAGLGQAYVISMGGDVVAGTNFMEAFQIFEHDDNTEGIIMIGEVGGTAEEDAAAWVEDYRRRVKNPKPIMGLVGGIHAPRGRIMGHAGAWASPGELNSIDKIKRLERAGIVMVDHPEKFGPGMKRLLDGRTTSSGSVPSGKRELHTMRQRPRAAFQIHAPSSKRTLYIKQHDAFEMLKNEGISISEGASGGERLLSVSIDRTARKPAIVASPTTSVEESFTKARKFPFVYKSGEASADPFASQVADHLGISSDKDAVKQLVTALVKIFEEREGLIIETKFVKGSDGKLTITAATFLFDDESWATSKRQKEIHVDMRDIASEVKEEAEAGKSGMILVKLEGEGSIGTIVNGAGLAMNTVDALVQRGGSPANFLDTGGKATSSTINEAFRLVTADPRVKALFVNICGGITSCAMIADVSKIGSS